MTDFVPYRKELREADELATYEAAALAKIDVDQATAERMRHEAEVRAKLEDDESKRVDYQKAAIDATLRAERERTHRDKENLNKPIEIPPLSECCHLNNLNDTNFAVNFCIGLCPCPGWCILQNRIMKAMAIPQKDPERPVWNVAYDQFGFTGLSLVSCCMGLAWNRERIRDRTATKEHNFIFDCMLFCCCYGWCLLMRDHLFESPIKRRVGKTFDEGVWTCFNLRKLKDSLNCVGCCLQLCCPIPGVCVVQSYTVHELEKIHAASLQNRNIEFLKPLGLNCCLCCFGFAYNRTVISELLGYDEQIATDCLKYSLPLCMCLVMQEFYTLNALKAKLREEQAKKSRATAKVVSDIET